ncbi:hypothetical protein HID58_060141, partial [Brassica napus]
SALSRIYGSFEKPSEKKKGYVLPRADGEDGENCHREKTWKKRAESHSGLSVKSLLVLSEPQRGKPVLLVSLLERAAEVVKNSNDGLWRASFDEFFTLLTKYCRSKYETIHGQNQENAAAEVFEAAIKREMPAELLRASLRHTSEDQQNFLLNFGRKGFSSPPVSELKTGARSSQVNSESVRD